MYEQMFIKKMFCIIILICILTGCKDNESLKYSFSKMQHYFNLIFDQLSLSVVNFKIPINSPK